MQSYKTKAARDEFIANWYRTVGDWQNGLKKDVRR